VIDYTKTPWKVLHNAPISGETFIESETPLGRIAIAKVFDLAGNFGSRAGNASLIGSAPLMAEFLLSGYQHVSHGGPKRGDLENLLRKIGLIS